MIQSIKEIINYLYRFKSSFLLVIYENEIKGFVDTKDIISLMNSGIDTPESILYETKIKPISSITNEEIKNNKVFILLSFPSKNIDLISQNEMNYLITGEISNLKINFESVMKNLPIPIAITDRTNKIIWVNTSFLDLFQLEEEEIIGKDITIFIPSSNPVIIGRRYKIVSSEIIAYDVKVKLFILLS